MNVGQLHVGTVSAVESGTPLSGKEQFWKRFRGDIFANKK